MSARDPSGIRIIPLSEVNPSEAAQLLQRCMAEGFGREKSDRLWRWKHIENPAGVSLGLAARDQGGILVGLRPFMRWRLRDSDGNALNAARAVDTAVAPEWRGHGLFSGLTREAIPELERSGVELIFNTPNEQSAPGYSNMGWRLVAHPRLWVRVASRALIGRGHEAMFPDSWRRVAAGAFSAANDEGGTAADGSRADACAEREPRAKRTVKPPLTPARDAAWYRWRYGAHPNLTYYLLPADSAGRQAIVRADRRRGREGIALVDVLGGDKARAGMPSFSIPHGFQYAVARPYLSGCGSVSAAAALAHGWVPLAWRAVTFAWRPLGDTPDTLLESPESWAFSLGDLETF